MARIIYSCPRCFNNAEVVEAHVGITWQVECSHCRLQGPEINSRYEAVSKWNELVSDWQ